LLLLSQLEGFLCLGEGLVRVQRDILLLLHRGQSSIVGVTGSELRARRSRQDHALNGRGGGSGATWHTLCLIVEGRVEGDVKYRGVISLESQGVLP
jgi:hypothetical protein